MLGRLDTGLARRLPVLHEQITSRWLGTLQSFVALDLDWLSERGYRPIELEYSTDGTLDLGAGQTLRLAGRFDRRVEGKDGLLIGDYKASRRLERKAGDMLKGKQLQVPLYRMLAGDAARVELLGVHPDLDYDHEPCRETFVGFADPRQERGFQETLRIIKDVAERGSFTFREGSCAWCPYDRACRRHHPPTVEREELAEDAARFRRLDRKNTKQPTLATSGAGGPRS